MTTTDIDTTAVQAFAQQVAGAARPVPGRAPPQQPPHALRRIGEHAGAGGEAGDDLGALGARDAGAHGDPAGSLLRSREQVATSVWNRSKSFPPMPSVTRSVLRFSTLS